MDSVGKQDFDDAHSCHKHRAVYEDPRLQLRESMWKLVKLELFVREHVPYDNNNRNSALQIGGVRGQEHEVGPL